VRLQKAKQLLQNKEFNVAEVSYKVGFTDPSYFSRVFKDEFDCTPSEI
jgi:AraC-like DNA-binding protein